MLDATILMVIEQMKRIFLQDSQQILSLKVLIMELKVLIIEQDGLKL